MLRYLSMKYYIILQGKASSTYTGLYCTTLLRWLATVVSCVYHIVLYINQLVMLAGLHGEHSDIHLNMYNEFPGIPLLFESPQGLRVSGYNNPI